MKKAYKNKELQLCFEAGFDVGKNGANVNNSGYSFFVSLDRAKAWEQGQLSGRREKK